MSHRKPFASLFLFLAAWLMVLPGFGQQQPAVKAGRKSAGKPTPVAPPVPDVTAPPAVDPGQTDYLTGRKIGTWYLQRRFYMVDANGDELLDKEELEYFPDEFGYYLDPKSFRVADRNNDLHISPNEMRAALDDELVFRRVREKIEIGDLIRRFPNLANPTLLYIQDDAEIAGALLGNVLWMTEHSDIVSALLADKSWLTKTEKALFTVNKNLTWLASNPRKAEELYKNAKVKKMLTRLEPWRKAHLEFIRDNAADIRDITYSMQLFDREKVEIDNSEFSPLDSTTTNAALDSLSARLRKAREENAGLTADLALIREQGKQEQTKLQERITYLEKQIGAVQADMARTELERNKLTDQIMLQSEAMRKLAVEKERQRGVISDQSRQIASLSTARDTLSSTLATVRIENAGLKGNLASKSTAIDTLQVHLNAATAANIQANRHIQALTLNVKVATTRIDSLTLTMRNMDAERRAALEQATGLELALKSAEEEMQSATATQNQNQGRVDERLAENVRQRDQINRLANVRDSLMREVQRLEGERNDLVARESRSRLAAATNVAAGPAPASVANMPSQPAGPSFADLEVQRKRADQLERERAGLEDQLESNVRLIQAISGEKERLENAVRELQAQTRAFDVANDSLNRLLNAVETRDLPMRMARMQRSTDSLNNELKISRTEAQRLTANNRALQEQVQRKTETDVNLETKRGEVIAREQQVEQRMTALTAKEAQLKVQEQRLSVLEAKERELKQLEQRLKQQEEALKRQATTLPVATPANGQPAVASAASTPPAKPATTPSASPTTSVAATPPPSKPAEAPRDANGAALNAPATAQLRIAIPGTEDLAKVQTYFSQKGIQGVADGNRLTFNAIKLPEIGESTYTIQVTQQSGAAAAEKTLTIVVQTASGEFVNEEKYPVETLKAKILFKRIYR